MFAHAILAVTTAIERDHGPAPAGLIELTTNEFRRLFDVLWLGAKHTAPLPRRAGDCGEQFNPRFLLEIPRGPENYGRLDFPGCSTARGSLMPQKVNGISLTSRCPSRGLSNRWRARWCSRVVAGDVLPIETQLLGTHRRAIDEFAPSTSAPHAQSRFFLRSREVLAPWLGHPPPPRPASRARTIA